MLSCRLLSSFHTNVSEITIIATPDAELDPAHASKHVQMRSFNDPAKGDAQPLHSFNAPCARCATPISSTRLQAPSYVPKVVFAGAAHADKALYTQLSLDTQEVFLQYQHSSDSISDVTFNLKDFKHMLAMCESLGARVAIRFDQPGAPLVVEPHFVGTHVRACNPWIYVSCLL